MKSLEPWQSLGRHGSDFGSGILVKQSVAPQLQAPFGTATETAIQKAAASPPSATQAARPGGTEECR